MGWFARPGKRTAAWGLLLAVVTCTDAASTARGDLTGHTILISQELPPADFEVGPFSYQVGFSSPIALSNSNNLFASATANTLTITFGPEPGDGGPFAPLEHFVLFDNLYAGSQQQIVDIEVDSNLIGFSEFSHVEFTAHSVTIGEGGLLYDGNQTVVITLIVAVPEPSSFALGCLGVVGLAVWRCRRANRRK